MTRIQFSYYRAFFVTLVLSSLASACAKETSEEERRREQVDRERSRLQKAEGTYLGYVAIDENKIVPASVDLKVNQNPQSGDESPTLAAAVRIGMFGGVVLSSDQTSYDAGDGRISLNLSKKGGGGAAEVAANALFELKGYIRDGKFVDSTIGGANTGTHAMSLAKDGLNLFTEQYTYTYATQITDVPAGGALASNAQLSLKRSTSPRPGPSSSDMPQLPGLEASLRFANLGVVPQVASDVLYEPLSGYMDMRFSDNMYVHVENIYLSRDALSMALTDWKPAGEISGHVIQGSAIAGYVRLGSSFPGLGLAAPDHVKEKPPQYFVGTFKGTNSATTFRAIASLEYQQGQGTNSAEFPFAVFPKLKLKLKLCSGDQPIQSGDYALTALDQVRGVGRFVDTRATAEAILDISYLDNWNTMVGKFTSGSSDTIDTSNPQLRLSATTTPIGNCATTVNITTPRSDEEVIRALAARPSTRFSTSDNLRYVGYVEQSNGSKVPAAVEVVPRRNPNGGNDEPTIVVNLSVGFFGAPIVGSEVATFDWVTGSVAATYKRAAGSNVELKMTLTDDVLTDATLNGPNFGTSHLVLSKSGPDYFDKSNESRFKFNFKSLDSSNTELTSGQLFIKRIETDAAAPANVDLPTVPTLQVALRFDGLGQTPQVARTATYDAQRGTLSLVLSDSSRLEFEQIFLAPVNGGSVLAAPATLTGRLFGGSTPRAGIVASRLDETSAPEITLLPPKTFKGAYRGSAANAMKFRAIAYVDYLGTSGENSGEFLFPTFPAMRLRIAICDPSGRSLKERVMKLGSYDYLTGSALFVPATNGDGGDILVQTNAGWQNLEGKFLSSSGGSSPTDATAVVSLNAAPLGANGCQETTP